MSNEFNAYHRWLGIPLHEQPPHHYRLLGIGLFEKNVDVIASAADRQMAHVKSFQNGAHAAASQKLLNEIAAVRVCLLNVEQKKAYDAALRAKLQASRQKSQAAASAETEGVEAGLHALGIDVAPVTTGNHGRRKKGTGTGTVIGYGVVGLVILGMVGGYFAMQSGKTPPAVAKVDNPDKSPKTPTKPTLATVDIDSPTPEKATEPTVSEPKPAGEEKPTTTPAAPVTPSTPKTPPKVKPTGSWTSADDELTPPETKTGPTAGTPTTPNTGPLPVADPVPTMKQPVPPPEAREKARKLVLELFASDFAKAKSPTEKAAVANKLLASTANAGDDAVGRFMLIEQARQTAIEAGDPAVAMSAVDELIAGYAVDAVALSLNTFQQLAPQTRTPAVLKVFAERALGASDGALSADKFDAAATLVDLAVAAAKKANDPATLKDVLARAKQFSEQRAELEKVAAARQTLTANPDDPDANLIVGRYYVFGRNDWERGLPFLAKIADATWKAAAADDVQNPAEAAAQIKTADNWWNLAAAEAKDRAVLRQRAAHWYSQAVNRLSGLEKARVEKRLDELAGAAASGTNGPGLAVVPFTLEVARERQLQWARHIKVTPQRTNSVGMKLTLIPPGEFTMGSPNSEEGRRDDEGPTHKVRLSKPYYVGVEEVTLAQFTLFVNATQHQTDAERMAVEEAKNAQMNDWRNWWRNGFGGRGRGPGRGGLSGGGPSGPLGPAQPGNNNNNNNNNNGNNSGNEKILTWKNPPFVQTKESPVVNVSWNDAVAFCKWLSKKEGLEYRLPTEAEWEFAARAGTSSRFSFGDEPGQLGAHAWYSANARQMPHPGSQKKGNQFGVVDMLGNVWEWVGDHYGSYTSDKATDPTGTSGGRDRAVRGGGFADDTLPRCAARQSLAANRWDDSIGFRVVAVPPVPKE